MLKKTICALILTLLLTGCAGQNADTPSALDNKPEIKPKPLPSSQINPAESRPPSQPHVPSAIEGQLIALADSQEEAEEIAGLYEIELLSYSNGVALYYTDEDTDAVIARGRSNDWPVLSKNDISQTYSAY